MNGHKDIHIRKHGNVTFECYVGKDDEIMWHGIAVFVDDDGLVNGISMYYEDRRHGEHAFLDAGTYICSLYYDMGYGMDAADIDVNDEQTRLLLQIKYPGFKFIDWEHPILKSTGFNQPPTHRT